MKRIKRIRCAARSAAAWCRGVKWDGHCWDAALFGVRCVDCGKRETTR